MTDEVNDQPLDARVDWEARVGLRSDVEAPVELPRLAAPSGLRIAEGRGQVTLSWGPVAGAAGYLVQRSEARDGPFETIVVGEPIVRPIPDTTLSDTSGMPGQAAWYRVAAAASVSDDGQPSSAPVRGTPQATGDGRARLRVDVSHVIGSLARPWRPIIGSEHLSLLTYGRGPAGIEIGDDFGTALRTVHDELGVEAVRAHAILHDELGAYREVDGRPEHDFSRIGAVYDRLLEIGLRPIVEISFMPRDLARDPKRTVFQYNAIISPPRDWERWGDLVRALTAYLVDRYGREEVRGWGFEVWNEANLEVFWSGTRQEYMRLYDVTAAAVKKVDSSLRVGGPSSAAVGWIDEMLAHVNASGGAIDFLSTHTYGNAPLDLRPIAERHGHPGLPLWWTEWGAHASHFHPLHDSAWAGGYLVHGMKSAMGRLEALAYWVASDQFEELGWPPRLLHGGFGLLTVGNLRKPRYWTLWMLEQLADQQLDTSIEGDGAGDMLDAVATRDDTGRVGLLAWNIAIDSSQADGNPLLDRRLTVEVHGLEARAYRLRHRRVDRQHSNLAGTWQAMGGREWPTDEQWLALREANQLEELEPGRRFEVTDGAVTLEIDLPMPAISLLELLPEGG
ncbi:MAG: xylan 1,4-beta-xylosidase [Chloroflexota bacterium]